MAARMTEERAKLIPKLAVAQRWHPDAPETQELRVKHAELELEEHITRIVDSAPPLSEKTRERLARLLWGADR